MANRDEPETGRVRTAVMLAFATFCITSFFLKSFYGYSGFVVPIGALWLCNVMDVFSLMVAPVLWCAYRFCEHSLKVGSTSVQYGSRSSTPCEPREFARDVAAELLAENQLIHDRIRERNRSVMEGEGIDEVDQVFIAQGMVPMEQFARGV
ncbi:hypothetical protein [Anaplasma platys]|uniref:hypothetical protein n=1 Tax=Anaplasma platys TaxID=949 RepID=UPI00145EB7D3|nr:hypothetical protein [Anaplasma platys]